MSFRSTPQLVLIPVAFLGLLATNFALTAEPDVELEAARIAELDNTL